MLLGRFAEGDHILADVEEDGKIVFKKVDPDDGGKKKKKELVQS
jgi:hypothetical protein